MATPKRKAAREKKFVHLGRTAGQLAKQVEQLQEQLANEMAHHDTHEKNTMSMMRSRDNDNAQLSRELRDITETSRKRAVELTLLRDEVCQFTIDKDTLAKSNAELRKELTNMRASDRDSKKLRRRLRTSGQKVEELQTMICRMKTAQVEG